ncbi:RNA polymerase factor sigma-54 [Oceanobacillus damuensis]|uniref:RNA polymerase factor sigma-54 n=1 Tax=Oceanobacillus damuensis TaxID=937928 RepID=UPI000831EC9F|nr:RNA polymerase factor sigma-54 [Oceanobacillus damuensis]
MKQKLVLKQSLQWKMNQSLMQSINILQLTSNDLIEYLKEVAKENPLIEEVDSDMDWEQFRPVHSNVESIGEFNQSVQTMYEQLKGQLFMLRMDNDLRPIVEFGIDSLNEDGYLDIELEEWGSTCDTTIETVEEALIKIQSLEPAGIGARNLQECILLQLKQFNNYDPFMENLLLEHLELIADADLDSICEIYGISIEEAKSVIDNIRLCNPKPGRQLSTAEPEYIIPEATIYREEGQWKLSFYKWATPKINLNPQYENLKDPANEATDYLKQKYKEIDTLKQAIYYRGNTLERVIRVIMEKQLDFFESGPNGIQPLTLREIAGELNLHTSTVSRAISQKYVQTTQGVLPLKFFLQSGIRKGDGNFTAAFAIKRHINEMIKMEDKKKPLSDEAIKKKLKNEYGIDVARRTVMKYRDQLHIPPSTKRKQGE